jgi:hypothetical protein
MTTANRLILRPCLRGCSRRGRHRSDRTPSKVLTTVIASLHVASGAAAGALTRSRLLAVLIGPALHLAADGVPHRDIANRNLDLVSGIVAATTLALRYGPTHPVTLGGVAAAAPDLEHVWPVLRPAGAKLFHGRRGWHRAGRLPVGLQMAAAVLVIGVLAMRQVD